MTNTENTNTKVDDAITVKELFDRIRNAASYAMSRWLVIGAFTILGAISGALYSIFKKPVYTAMSTFVLEDGSKLGSLGQYAGLASLAGIDLNSNSGLFQGDNILELYKSRLMIEKALLSEAVFGGKDQQLIERYIDSYHLRERWKSRDGISAISFRGDPEHFNRKQDSIITDLTEDFNKNSLVVNKPDKKLNIIQVEVASKDELFAKEFTKKLVQKVNEFYVQTKTKKSFQNVQILQHQADSVRLALNSSISGVASAIDAAPNANPQLLSLKVPSQKRQVDVQASSAVYAEIVKNLEISKISLRQDIPLIQLIDQPVLPLENDHVSIPKGIVLGAFIGAFITAFILIAKKLTWRV
ncbi:Wzz/FepE/Etk N-terminal domain-containing protein [Mucilaginibacter sp. CAU 1740]|uniref:Wzz/FepE/Etk N-terminal domain-containing protein n=1 Tax=Mucilaginibacter sp. CAU 1740 TaxID=3140365 RepID=UPI00325B1E8F